MRCSRMNASHTMSEPIPAPDELPRPHKLINATANRNANNAVAAGAAWSEQEARSLGD